MLKIYVIQILTIHIVCLFAVSLKKINRVLPGIGCSEMQRQHLLFASVSKLSTDSWPWNRR